MKKAGNSATEVAPSSTDDAKNEQKEQQPKTFVRRHKGGHGWCIPDRNHAYFNGSFQNGLLTHVTFIGKAPAMVCIEGHPSTGEAEGILTERVTKLPSDAIRSETVMYDGKRHTFHVKGKRKEQVTTADYLLLLADGTSIAGWKS